MFSGDVVIMKLHNIEFLRFIFAVTIVYYHILHSNIIKFVGKNGDYHFLQKLSVNAGWIVECFFIISGYFLYTTLHNSKEDIKEFVLKKIFRLGPVLWLSIIFGIIFFKQSIIVGLFNSLFLQCVGLSLDYKGINWYISPFFWASIFLFSILKTLDSKRQMFFLGALTYLAYVVNITYCNGGFGRETVYGLVNLGLARALAGIGLGYMIAVLLETFKDLNWFSNKRIQTVLVSVIEITSFSFLIKYFLFGLKHKNAFVVVIVFSILFICFVKKQGVLSRSLNRPIFSRVGKYSYSIYVMQQTCFYILAKTIWITPIIQETILCLFCSLVFCVLIGILVYYCVERPMYKKGAELMKGNGF